MLSHIDAELIVRPEVLAEEYVRHELLSSYSVNIHHVTRMLQPRCPGLTSKEVGDLVLQAALQANASIYWDGTT